MSAEARMGWIERQGALAVTRQCELASVARASWYGRQARREESEEDQLLCRLIDEKSTRWPFYGSRRMVVSLSRQGHLVNRKRVQRLMRLMGLAGLAPGPTTNTRHPERKVYPYPLRGIQVTRPNQVWSTDITYYPAGTWLRVFGGGDRLVFAPGARLANQQQNGHLVLHRLCRRCPWAARQAGDRQHQPGIAVHEHDVHGRAQAG